MIYNILIYRSPHKNKQKYNVNKKGIEKSMCKAKRFVHMHVGVALLLLVRKNKKWGLAKIISNNQDGWCSRRSFRLVLFFCQNMFYCQVSFCCCLFVRLVGNGWVYEKLGISERFTVKPHKVKCEQQPLNLVLPAQFFIYLVTNWAFFFSVNGLS